MLQQQQHQQLAVLQRDAVVVVHELVFFIWESA